MGNKSVVKALARRRFNYVDMAMLSTMVEALFDGHYISASVIFVSGVLASAFVEQYTERLENKERELQQ